MIRVIIERKIKEDCLDNYLEHIRKARKTANSVDGFIAGELLHEKGCPLHAIIISSWENNEAWEAWSVSEQRLAALKSVRSFLEQEESEKLENKRTTKKSIFVSPFVRLLVLQIIL